MNTYKQKKEARKKYRAIRMENISLAQDFILIKVKEYINSLALETSSRLMIGIYWPLAGEVDLTSLKNIPKIALALPVGHSRGSISYHRWTNTPLGKDSYGIPAPISEPPLHPQDLNLLLVPALAIDQNGIRLGYGGGCFDRLRMKPIWSKTPAFVITPKACITDSLLPRDNWDIPFNGWINEKEILEIENLKL
ncbi:MULTISPECIES: 5-formyltetrahydrofolate cyclo-ligase [unclassified Prochlorococcus]|uniref:5-formyltetrahydrofolate cyclo-ligase n=1 Tax=unclassified Prochlorococcus TaxID=2627481 RepID=UPI000533BCFC|nr:MULTISPECIES: 5-formyltetrahydrofolate cyclo-ligase [unclassified Prochlorococcus]KGG15476.1 5-formyltetrahydrofolate cyclo-ligase [Prochlorococcus sp. MIT 0602]KGG17756.1 5-formyltetrahydrofolate cyclo-ligase [Prochlorococcus sp. MIT 0603]